MKKRNPKLLNTVCPTCDAQLDEAASVDGDFIPKPGDYTICVYCASYLIYKKNMSLRELTAIEISEWADKERAELTHIRRVVEGINRKMEDSKK